MFSILTDALPEFISVGDVVFGVNTDFRVWLRVGQLLSDAGTEIEPAAQQKLLQDMFELVVPADGMPNGYILGSDFIEAVTKFYIGPLKNEPEPDEPEKPEPKKPKAAKSFDFVYDADYIYQSFASFYRIRLCEVKMHWWEFLTLFDGLMLSEGNSMNFVVGVRKRKLNDVPKASRASYGKMKKALSLPSVKKSKAENDLIDKLESMWENANGGQSDHQN